MQLVIIIVFGALLGISNASSVDVSGTVVNATNNAVGLLDIVQILLAKLRNQCPSEDLAKVADCLAGHIKVFATYTGTAKCSGDAVITAFTAHIALLKRWNECISTILSLGAKAIIHALSFLYKLGKDAIVFLTENGKATPQLVATYINTVTSYDKQIGCLYRIINESLRSLEKLFAEILKQFLNRNSKCGCARINFEGIMDAGRLLAIRVAFILNIALADCTKFAVSVFEVLAIICLITYDIIMAIQAVLTTMASEIIKQSGSISSELETFLNELTSFTLAINETITLLKSCRAEDVKRLLQTVQTQLSAFSQNMSPCPIGITAAEVKQNLAKA